MANDINPYQPPPDTLPSRSGLLARIRDWWNKNGILSGVTDEQLFKMGRPMIWYGVIFQIDKDNVERFSATIPGARDEPDYLARVQHEACRVATELVETRPELAERLRDCSLNVRIAYDYDDLKRLRQETLLSRDEWLLATR